MRTWRNSSRAGSQAPGAGGATGSARLWRRIRAIRSSFQVLRSSCQVPRLRRIASAISDAKPGASRSRHAARVYPVAVTA